MKIIGKIAPAGLLLAAAAGIGAGGATLTAQPTIANAQAWKHRWKPQPHHRGRHRSWRRRGAAWGQRRQRTWVRGRPGRVTGLRVRRGPFAGHVSARHLRRVGPGRWATAGGYGNTRGGGFLYRGQARRVRGGIVEQGRWVARNGHAGTYSRGFHRSGNGWQRNLTISNNRGQTVSLGRSWRREADGSRTWALTGQGADGRTGGVRWNSRTGWSRY